MDIESMKQGIEGNRLLKGIILAFCGGIMLYFIVFSQEERSLTTRFSKKRLCHRTRKTGKHVRQHPHNR